MQNEKCQSPIFYDLSPLGLLKISGNGAKTLLQGQLTIDIEKINSTHASLAAHCNPQGRIISFFHLFLMNDDYYLLMKKTMVPITLSALKKYALFYQVSLTDESQLLNKVGWQFLPECHHDQLHFVRLAHDLARGIIIGESSILEKCGLEFSGTQQAFSAWHALNILQNIPSIYPETSATFLPHDLHLPDLQAVDFAKGCYTGQEIIARMHYKSKLKNHLYRAFCDASFNPTPGTLLFKIKEASRPSGIIVDGCLHHGVLNMLVMTDESTAQHHELFFSHNQIDYTIKWESLWQHH